MPDQIKKHTTVKITMRTIAGLNPCASGVENAKPFLPATLSTDPHKNLKLADKWIHSDRYWDLFWLMDRLNVNKAVEFPDDEYSTVAFDEGYGTRVWINYERDVWVIAQIMAILADQLATREGR